jgi:thiol:disulfide interchange protein DsbD
LFISFGDFSMRNVVLMFAVIAAAFTARAEEIPPSPIVKTQMVVNAASFKKGDTVWAGVQFTMPEHWHIYWKNPGDSGLATSYKWTLPEGVSAGDIHWPTPERIETGGLVNYGYSNQVLLPVPLTIVRDGAKGEVKVTAKWLVCKDICIPESAMLSATLPTQTADAEALFAQALKATAAETIPDATYSATDDLVILRVPLNPQVVKKAQFFPEEDGIISNSELQQFSVPAAGTEADKAVVITAKRGSSPLVSPWHGTLHLIRFDEATHQSSMDSFTIIATRSETAVAANAAAFSPSSPADSMNLVTALLLAFVGGLVLNIMPCVLPILALKALAIAKKAGVSRREAARQGIAYTVGVVGSFLLIAAGMLALKASGSAVGWGFQLQHASFVALLALVMILVAANLLGLFELPVLFGTRASQVDDSTVGGSFLTGVLAVLVATPCTAPFMATAIGATLSLSAVAALLVFAALGLGMAAPFLAISLWPAARRFLPKPGAWMKRFKHLLAIPMLATAVWLIWVFVQLQFPSDHKAMAGHEVYSAAKLSALREAGTPVLLDATADWCLTCKINERVAINPQAMQDFLHAKNVVLMVADWTASDPAITALLTSFGRAGVPLYVYYPPHGEPVVLPQILTPAMVRNVIAPESN